VIVSQAQLDASAREGKAAGAPPASHADIARRVISKRWAAILAHEAGARRGEDVEALHAMRVASRRLRSALRVFGPYLPERAARRVGKRIRRLTRALGAPREWDVHSQLLGRLHAAAMRPDELAAIEHVWEFVDERRTAERARMIERLDAWDGAGLAGEVDRLVARIRPRHHACDAPAEAAWTALAPLVDKAFARLPALREKEHPEALHAMRIDVKRLRYAIELLKANFVTDHRALVADMAGIQEMLGTYHDHTLLETLIAGRLSRLSQHGRRTLVEGLIRPMDTLTAERHAGYAGFIRATAGVSAANVTQRIRTALGRGKPVD
jgi:CHAD domain-containing protein